MNGIFWRRAFPLFALTILPALVARPARTTGAVVGPLRAMIGVLAGAGVGVLVCGLSHD